MADSAKVQDYKEEVKKQAEQLVLKGFPETIVSLNSILETAQFKNRQFSEVHQDLNIPVPEPIVLNSHTELPPAKKTKLDNRLSQDGTKVMVLPTGAVSTNKHLVDLIEQVKPHIRKLVEDSNLLKSLTTEEILENASNMVSACENDLENKLGDELVQFAELLKTDLPTILTQTKGLLTEFATGPALA
nr:proteasome activator complex subunit 3 [Leptinotarsa decemlineata]